MNPLTPSEERVIVHKGTERAFTGKYCYFFGEGTYLCKRCNAPLYRSESKFESECGWPSFDDEIPGAVLRQPDADGARIEILCARCGGHLGHVFSGEGLTPKNTRHCVNSISLNFAPGDVPLAMQQATSQPLAQPAPASETAIFAGGCFWGVEHHFQRAPGVLHTQVGYTGGKTTKPTYEQVCRGNTGHIEAIEVTYDPAQTTYEALAKLFFEIHDPTQVNGQGPDIGDQYRSVVFYNNQSQKESAANLMNQLEREGYQVATQLRPAEPFWPAEEYHQRYYEKTGKAPYCHVYTPRFK